MRFIPTRVHGAADYLIGIVLILAPWIFGFATGGAAQWVTILIGLAIIVYSLLTDYELGLSGVIPMPVHLYLDIAAGVVLIISPWLFGFATVVFWPHVIVGILDILAGLTTSTTPERTTTSNVR